MVNLGSFLILSCGIIAYAIHGARSDDCITYQHSLKYYQELNCIPTKDEAKNCITSFNCSSIFTQKEDKCYYQGKQYSIGQDLNENEIRSNCIPGCRCSSAFGRAQFSCPHVDCPENFQPPLEPNCVRTYSHDSCCATGKQCEGDNAEPKVAKCEYGGNVYTEGSSFYPEETPCKKCICKPGFNGTLDSPWCEDIFCEIEIHYADNVQEACAPVYYGKNSCCPIYFHCQSQSEEPIVIEGIQPETSFLQKTNDDSHQCKFGNMTIEIGRKITPPGECIECSCSVPPFVSCILDGECQEKQRTGKKLVPATKSENN